MGRGALAPPPVSKMLLFLGGYPRLIGSVGQPAAPLLNLGGREQPIEELGMRDVQPVTEAKVKVGVAAGLGGEPVPSKKLAKLSAATLFLALAGFNVSATIRTANTDT